MEDIQKLGIILIGVLTASSGVLTEGFMANHSMLTITIGLIPIILGRVALGKSCLNHLESIYGSTIAFMGLINTAVIVSPQTFNNFYLQIYRVFTNNTGSAVITDPNNTFLIEEIIASALIFSILYTYREGYLKRLYRRYNKNT